MEPQQLKVKANTFRLLSLPSTLTCRLLRPVSGERTFVTAQNSFYLAATSSSTPGLSVHTKTYRSSTAVAYETSSWGGALSTRPNCWKDKRSGHKGRCSSGFKLINSKYSYTNEHQNTTPWPIKPHLHPLVDLRQGSDICVGPVLPWPVLCLDGSIAR